MVKLENAEATRATLLSQLKEALQEQVQFFVVNMLIFKDAIAGCLLTPCFSGIKARTCSLSIASKNLSSISVYALFPCVEYYLSPLIYCVSDCFLYLDVLWYLYITLMKNQANYLLPLTLWDIVWLEDFVNLISLIAILIENIFSN